MKKFFYACLAILCLVLAFHYGATSAQGQQAGSYFEFVGDIVVRSGNELYSLNGPLGAEGWGIVESLPTSPASVVFYNNTFVVSVTGETWARSGGVWRSIGSVPGGATPATRTTFGALKARYR